MPTGAMLTPGEGHPPTSYDVHAPGPYAAALPPETPVAGSAPPSLMSSVSWCPSATLAGGVRTGGGR